MIKRVANIKIIVRFIESCHFIVIVQDLANMDADDLLKKQVEHMEKERREKETRQKTQEKKVELRDFAHRGCTKLICLLD